MKRRRVIMAAVAVLSVAAALMLLSTAVLPALTGSGYQQMERGGVTHQVLGQNHIQTNVTVLGGTGFADLAENALDGMAAAVITASDGASLMEAADREGVVAVDCAEVSDMSWVDLGGILGIILLKGVPIILVNDTDGAAKRLAEENGVSYVGGTGDEGHPITVKALKHNPRGGISGSLDLGGKAGDNGSLSENLRTAYWWGAERLENAPESAAEGNYIVEMVYSYSYCSGDAYEPYGRFTVVDNFIVKSYRGPEGRQDYYGIHHYFESDPGHGAYGSKYRTASMVNEAIYSQGSMVRYGPSTAYGTDSVGVYLSVMSGDRLLRWGYGIRDVTVLDGGVAGMEKVRWTHQPSEDSQASWMPYIAEPGAMVRTEAGAPMEFTGSYSVSWERPLLFGGGSHTGAISVDGRIMPLS